MSASTIAPTTRATLRDEVRHVLRDPRTQNVLDAIAKSRQRHAPDSVDVRPVLRLLGDHRLLAVHWPVAFGGRGLDPTEHSTVVGELIEAGIPDTLHTLSVQIFGNFLLSAGSRAQRATLLPPLARGTTFATILYSEPDVGSDLAALTTAAYLHADGRYRLRGRKTYSVSVGLAELALVAARTSDAASRYSGISLFVVPLRADGVRVARLTGVADEPFGDVLLEDVAVAADAMVGPLDQAWPLITQALDLERTGIDYAAKSRRWLGRGRKLLGSAGAREDAETIGRLTVSAHASALLAAHAIAQPVAATVAPAAAALYAATKWFTSETAQQIAWWCGGLTALAAGSDATGSDTTGSDATLDPNTSLDPNIAVLDAAYREAPGLTISAGSSEMMLEVVAASELLVAQCDTWPSTGAGSAIDDLVGRVRAVLTGGAELPGDPVVEAGRHPYWPELEELGLFDGRRIGLVGEAALCHELGRATWDGGVLRALCGDAPTSRGDHVRRAAWLCGLTLSTLVLTTKRVQQRTQFGRPVLDNQHVRLRLAALTCRLVAAQLLVIDSAARTGADNDEDGDARGGLAFAGELTLDATRLGMQLHGAYGMTGAAPISRYYRVAPAVLGAAGPLPALYRAATRSPS